MEELLVSIRENKLSPEEIVMIRNTMTGDNLICSIVDRLVTTSFLNKDTSENFKTFDIFLSKIYPPENITDQERMLIFNVLLNTISENPNNLYAKNKIDVDLLKNSLHKYIDSKTSSIYKKIIWLFSNYQK